MIIITRESKAQRAATAWKYQYGPNAHGGQWYRGAADGGISREDTYNQLLALGSTPDPDAVDSIIGNSSWTQPPACSECECNDTTPRIQVGETPDYESNTVWLCSECAEQAANEMRAFLARKDGAA